MNDMCLVTSIWLGRVVRTSHFVRTVTVSTIDWNKSPLKMSGKLDGHSYPGTPKNFQTTHIGYRAHHAVIFAIAWHLVHLTAKNDIVAGSELSATELHWLATHVENTTPVTGFSVLSASFSLN